MTEFSLYPRSQAYPLSSPRLLNRESSPRLLNREALNTHLADCVISTKKALVPLHRDWLTDTGRTPGYIELSCNALPVAVASKGTDYTREQAEKPVPFLDKQK